MYKSSNKIALVDLVKKNKISMDDVYDDSFVLKAVNHVNDLNLDLEDFNFRVINSKHVKMLAKPNTRYCGSVDIYIKKRRNLGAIGLGLGLGLGAGTPLTAMAIAIPICLMNKSGGGSGIIPTPTPVIYDQIWGKTYYEARDNNAKLYRIDIDVLTGYKKETFVKNIDANVFKVVTPSNLKSEVESLETTSNQQYTILLGEGEYSIGDGDGEIDILSYPNNIVFFRNREFNCV